LEIRGAAVNTLIAVERLYMSPFATFPDERPRSLSTASQPLASGTICLLPGQR